MILIIRADPESWSASLWVNKKMSIDIDQFVPSSYCLECKMCCRYQEQESCWRPNTSTEEKKDVEKGALDFHGYIITVKHENLHVCGFLNIGDNNCRIYPTRPFECKLYPFLLAQDDSKFCVKVHLACPYVQDYLWKDEYKQYVSFLEEYFARQDVLGFLYANPSLFGDYAEYEQEMGMLFSINKQ